MTLVDQRWQYCVAGQLANCGHGWSELASMMLGLSTISNAVMKMPWSSDVAD